MNIFGNGTLVRVIDYLVDIQIDVSILDVCDGANISRKTAEKLLTHLTIVGVVKKTREVGRTEMFKINQDNEIAQEIIKINQIIIKQQEKRVQSMDQERIQLKEDATKIIEENRKLYK